MDNIIIIVADRYMKAFRLNTNWNRVPTYSNIEVEIKRAGEEKERKEEYRGSFVCSAV